MKNTAKRHPLGTGRNIRPGIYAAVLLVNVILFAFIGAVYVSSDRSYSQKLFDENVRAVESLNVASANAAYTYTAGMKVKINDIVSYIEANDLGYEAVLTYLAASNTDPDRHLQLILSGSYGATGQLSFGDYSGVAFRRQQKQDGSYETVSTDIRYGSGYYDILSSFTDVEDASNGGLCFAQEFTNPDTKQKCFAAYRHVDLADARGQKRLYTVLLAVHSETALASYNVQNEFDGQSAVLVNADGYYIIKNSDYRNANFYDYVVNYNALTLDWKETLQKKVQEGTAAGGSVNLYYKNHQGTDCVFALNAMKTGWYSITCVPLSSFRLQDTSINYSLVILLLFLALFALDGVALFFVTRVLRESIDVAERATKDAISANQAKSRFLSTMSHELRTPLNAIIGLVSLSGDSIDNPSVLKNYLKKIDISSKLLLQLISDILDVSAIESDKLRLNSDEFDIARLITVLSAIYYDQCAAKGIEFQVSLRNMSSTLLLGDSVRVNQVLLNYLSNAVKFTPNGGRVTLRAEQVQRGSEAALIRFEIEDTGCGISAEMQQRLFRPFERALGDTGRRHSGSGLGLSIAKSLVERMGGTVGVESTEGVGSCFFAEIPFGVPADAKRTSYSAIPNLRVLAVLQNPDERAYIGQTLAGFGAEYVLAERAEEALALLAERGAAKKPFHLCMIDWKLPDWNALDTVAQIKASMGDASPRIMVLAYDMAEASSRCVEAGADLVFGKPVFPSTLYNTLEEIAHNRTVPVAASVKDTDLTGRRVLLVEDNLLNVEIASLLLGKIGVEVETAENGQIGAEKFIASAPGYYDAVLMDVQMPVMNGYEAASAIRASANPAAKTVPIFAMTADAFAEDVEKARRAGMNEHISKPVVPENLYAVLKNYLHD